ncbi:aminoacyl-histidine dipeptidase [Bacteroidota bacterium]
MESTKDLITSRLWDYFEIICKIPRPSKSEKKITEYLLDFAKKNRIDTVCDNVGNILMRKPASPAMENLKTVILQSHLDMVGEKDPSSSHDFTRDPIIPVRDGDWIRANGTTLGADDGIGIAAQMLILENKELVHGPLECLYTVDEESGMTGAKYLESGFLKGKILINLDSEDEGELFIGCAGGIDTLGTFHFALEQPEKQSESFRISVSGLKGGHSGDEIHKSPGNSIKILNRFLLNASNEFGLRLSLFDGGNMRNAIPRDAYTIFTVPGNMVAGLENYYRQFTEMLSSELREFEPELKFELTRTKLPGNVLSSEPQLNFLKAIHDCPHGVINWSPTLKGLVETSTNLASVKFPDDSRAVLTTSQRSSVESEKMDIADRVGNCLSLGGGSIEHTDGYPGWKPNPDSEILNITKAAYRDLFKQEPIVRAIHAGLECGLILEKYPELDMLSFGPTIRGAHTPTERINIDSTEKFWKLLLEVLERIPKN